ncbi:MAG: nucleotidyl transferase AbiEii/AbiGii toxin family protein, partial [Synergistaceae bacterium]|nr:nucleotidyl transferase AbiEii/AbiGii toxin family protein [Synergistaceae bacterium]
MKNEFVYDNAKEILRKAYDNDMSLLPTIIKCSLHDGIMQSLNASGLLQQMVFHGGTSLQRIHGSARLSEDLDFCMRNDISELAVFKTFCKDFETVLKEDFSKIYGIDDSDIFFRESGKDTSIIQDGDVFTGKIGIVVPLGEKRQIINIELENREPLTAEIQPFGRLPNDAFQHDDIYLNVETKEEMLVNTFISLFQRTRFQYRDFYDIG